MKWIANKNREFNVVKDKMQYLKIIAINIYVHRGTKVQLRIRPNLYFLFNCTARKCSIYEGKNRLNDCYWFPLLQLLALVSAIAPARHFLMAKFSVCTISQRNLLYIRQRLQYIIIFYKYYKIKNGTNNSHFSE